MARELRDGPRGKIFDLLFSSQATTGSGIAISNLCEEISDALEWWENKNGGAFKEDGLGPCHITRDPETGWIAKRSEGAGVKGERQ